MNNYNLLYSTEQEQEEDSDVYNNSSDSEGDNSFQEEKINPKNIKYTTRVYNILLSSIDRDWKHLESSTFSFQIKFNASYNSLEERKTYSGDLQQNVNISNVLYTGSQSLSIPIYIKNIESIHIEKLIIPNRKNYLGNGVFNNTVNLNTILVKIEEFSFTNHGSNSGLDECFCAMASTTIDNNLKFIEYDNLNNEGKVFRPVPLNSINNLTIKLTDFLGNSLSYLNEYLQIKKMEINGEHDKYIKITTVSYFSRLNYQEGDIIIIKSASSNNSVHNNLINYLNQEIGHPIYFKTDEKIENGLEDLYNTFYISKKGQFNLSNGQYIIDSNLDYSNLETATVSGDIINRNLQLFLKFKIESRETDFTFFNPEII